MAELLSADEDHKQLLHHNYHRCLDIAGRCAFKSTICMFSGHHDRERFYNKWYKRWLVFAEKYLAEMKLLTALVQV